MPVLIATTLYSSLFAATAVFALPAEINTLCSARLLCLLNSLLSDIVIVSLSLMKIFAFFFSRTAPYWIAFFTLSTVLSPACSLKPISQKTLPPVLLWFSILLAVILNGILISTVLFLKAALATMVSGATFIILITPSSEMRFVPPCSIYFSKNLTPLLKLLKPFATLNINMVFMFMINLISVTKKLSLNTLADILDALLSLLPESIITMADRLLFIITATKMNSMFRKPFLSLISSKGSSAISLKNISK